MRISCCQYKNQNYLSDQMGHRQVPVSLVVRYSLGSSKTAGMSWAIHQHKVLLYFSIIVCILNFHFFQQKYFGIKILTRIKKNNPYIQGTHNTNLHYSFSASFFRNILTTILENTWSPVPLQFIFEALSKIPSTPILDSSGLQDLK